MSLVITRHAAQKLLSTDLGQYAQTPLVPDRTCEFVVFHRNLVSLFVGLHSIRDIAVVVLGSLWSAGIDQSSVASPPSGVMSR